MESKIQRVDKGITIWLGHKVVKTLENQGLTEIVSNQSHQLRQ
jgi:hypothetical protein